MGSTDTSLERKLQYLETKIDGAIGTIILDHPERRNALSRQLVDAVVETLDRFSASARASWCYERGLASRFGLRVTMWGSFPKAVGIRWAGTILYATWCEPLRNVPRL